ncbi:hypothetical protein HPT27_08850 [Permianibacter sp. IMCC34836]|uniref:hypothetical protein n=1 Tax=Permianibacter fluminis TaxID=2738515 RepID=UPI001555D378|nr:hypothetical protein [Permianibacter fluminis]NQD37132.1 hypothetical protein [Permianibacter fluminis]
MSETTDLSESVAELFNNGCACVSLDRASLASALGDQLGAPMADALAHHYPGLFANVALFLPTSEFRAMQQLIEAVESVVASSAYQQSVLANAPAVAQTDAGPAGAFMGYDFHRDGDKPKLIEINTNAGGAFLNAALRRAQQACCAEMAAVLWPPLANDFETSVLAMFREEWSRQRGQQPLRRIAIVDDQPEQQFLYPEFQLAKELFQRHGIDAVIADAGALQYQDGRLTYQNDSSQLADQSIDLVYSRLTDFLLTAPAHQALRQAYQDGAVVLTPNPHNYALYADKRNLIQLSDATQLQQWGVPAAVQTTLLNSIPKTLAVTAANAESLWRERKQWFFKPAQGFGSKASYRGDKLTKGTWADIIAGHYVAQTFAPPSERMISEDGAAIALKTDIRIYRYAGRSLLVAARLYQGQTTNMRTPGGGFAPVFLT